MYHYIQAAFTFKYEHGYPIGNFTSHHPRMILKAFILSDCSLFCSNFNFLLSFIGCHVISVIHALKFSLLRQIMCILCTPRPIYRSTSQSTYRPTLDWSIRWHIGRVSVDMSVDISAKCRSICRQGCVSRCIDRCINRDTSRVMVGISTDCRQISRSILRPTLGRYADHWLSVEYRSTAGGKSVKTLDC